MKILVSLIVRSLKFSSDRFGVLRLWCLLHVVRIWLLLCAALSDFQAPANVDVADVTAVGWLANSRSWLWLKRLKVPREAPHIHNIQSPRMHGSDTH